MQTHKKEEAIKYQKMRNDIFHSLKYLRPPPPQKSIFAKECPNQVKLGKYVDATIKSV